MTKTILITAYAVNPYKGSEEGTGWNLICQVARHHRVIAVTRKNNKADIIQYMQQYPDKQDLFDRIEFLHFDLPQWMIWWKKGPLLSALYFYMWQFFVAWWLKQKRLSFDIAHSLNFHSNWTPSFLWIIGKPFVWGPVGNHPLIPQQYIKIYGIQARLKDRMLWLVKWCFWNLDPFVYLCRKKAEKVFCVNTQAAEKLRLPQHKVTYMPAVASEQPEFIRPEKTNSFTVLSVGRFVPLKGFDLTIKSFALFYKGLSSKQQSQTNLLIIGTGPEKKRLLKLIEEENMQQAIQIKKWMPRPEVIQKFSQASAYLFPSHEGAGMVVAEALSYGLPVICLNNYGPGEYVHPLSDLKVEHDTYADTIKMLALKLKNLFKEVDYYDRESKLAIDQYNQNFRWSIKGDAFKEVYQQIILAKRSKSTINQPIQSV